MRIAAVALVVLVALAGCASQEPAQEPVQEKPAPSAIKGNTGSVADDPKVGNDSDDSRENDDSAGDAIDNAGGSNDGTSDDASSDSANADTDKTGEEKDHSPDESNEESHDSQSVEPVKIFDAAMEFPADRVAEVSWRVSKDVSSRLLVDGVEIDVKQGKGPHAVTFDVDRGASVQARIEANDVSRTLTGTSPVPELQLDVEKVERSHDRIAFTVNISGADDVEWRVSWSEQTAWSTNDTLMASDLAPETKYSFELEARTLDRKAAASLIRDEETKQIPWATGHDIRIAPGIHVSTPGGGCTGGFILTPPDNSTVYMAIAGHCIIQEGMPVNVGGQHDDDFGEAVAYNKTSDWGLIEIYPEYRWEVSPVVLGLQKPSDVAAYGSTQQGEEVCISGHGGNIEDLTQVRCGPFHEWTEDPGDGENVPRAQYWTWNLAGDSGGPVMDSEGRALAIHVAGSNAIGVGTSFEYALQQMEEAGFPVVLP